MPRKFFFAFFTFLLISCNKEIEAPNPKEIFEKYKGSVMLIACQYYYEVDLEYFKIYYSPSSKNKFYFTKDEILNNLTFSTGTGFAISNSGEIITNKHVVENNNDNLKTELYNFINSTKSNLTDNIIEINRKISILETEFVQQSDNWNLSQRESFENLYNELNQNKDIVELIHSRIDLIDFAKSKSQIVYVNLGVAYNDTYVTEIDDLQECVIIKTSKDDEVDLALLQTKNKKFNIPPKHYFNFEDNNPNITENPKLFKERDIKNPIKINDDVFMIGYNKGFTLANTRLGVKSQFTSGKISQENDGERILYTIPTLEGSSGSPIIDKWGNLVCVNFAKLNNSQNFSFGIPIYELIKFYKN